MFEVGQAVIHPALIRDAVKHISVFEFHTASIKMGLFLIASLPVLV